LAGLETLDGSRDINKVWKSIRENIKISAKVNLGYYGQKKRKPRFAAEYSESVDAGKIAVVTGSKPC
jgi:hypothetical protein